MKILKKLLLVGLCSFCFCISAKAYTNEDFPDVSSFVGTSNYAFNYNTTANRIDVVYCKNDSLLGTQYIVGGNLNDTKYYKCSSGAYYMRRLYKNGALFTDWTLEDLNNEVYNFNSSEYSWGSELSSSNNYGSYVKYNIDEERLYILSDMDDSVGVIYTPNDIYYSDFITSILSAEVFEEPEEENICDRTAVLGALSNVNEIKFNVKGETSALAEPLKGTFTLSYNSDNAFTTDDFIVELVNNSDVSIVGNYNLQCPDDVYACYLNYEYNTEDDIIETANFSFKIKLSNNNVISFMRLYACTTNDDYTNISYDYSNGPTDSITNNPNTDNYLQDGDISDSSNTVGSFFENFEDNDYGLSSIITIPLTSIQKLTNSSCIPISLPIPFTNKNIDLPCMTSLYEQNIPLLLNIWQTVSFGIISYTIIVDIFGLVKKFKNPEDDKLEVMDL